MNIEDTIENLNLDKRLLNKLHKLDIIKIKDLITYYPYKYENRLYPLPVSSILNKEDKRGQVYIQCRVISHSFIGSGAKETLKITAVDKLNTNTKIELFCFGRNYLSKLLTVDKEYSLYGTFYCKDFKYVCYNFDFEALERNEKFNKIIPQYKLKKVIPNEKFNSTVLSVLGKLKNINYINPQDKVYKMTKITALNVMHNPKSFTNLELARNNLVYEEVFDFITEVRKENNSKYKQKYTTKIDKILSQKLIDSLPYSLTQDQARVIGEIEEDFSKNYAQMRLILGEVGSGKTIVALISALMIVGGGGQVLLMAPTEILAKQHHQTVSNLLSHASIDKRIDFISGNCKKSIQKQILSDFKDGLISILIGTHSLIYAPISPNNVNLVIIDEQHRFGSNQREALKNISNIPNTLYLSATPIPRTLALAMFSQNEVSYIKSMPIDRKPIKTYFVWAKPDRVRELYSFIKEQLCQGRQGYFVYPLIEENEDIVSVKQAYGILKKEFSDYEIGLIHSGLPENQKNEIMDRFQSGEVKILISTIIIEVGINVINASFIVINHADRYGLSTLHQLRGRVGRGQYQSYCFLVSNGLTQIGKKRMNILLESLDGFEIANKDLENRGWGDLISGENQSGLVEFKLASYGRDKKIFDYILKKLN